jgi:hypothetical protein
VDDSGLKLAPGFARQCSRMILAMRGRWSWRQMERCT